MTRTSPNCSKGKDMERPDTAALAVFSPIITRRKLPVGRLTVAMSGTHKRASERGSNRVVALCAAALAAAGHYIELRRERRTLRAARGGGRAAEVDKKVDARIRSIHKHLTSCVETYEGERSLISRNTIKTVRIVSVANVNHLKGRVRENETFDPYAILGVAQGTAWDEIRAAYVNLSKVYHPDRFANVALPGEVRDYLSAMARRVNAAYAALEAPIQAARRASMAKAQPVFTSGQRI